MFIFIKKYLRTIAVVILLVSVVVVWMVIYSRAQTGMLTVSFLDVGQGDSILITTPSKKHILIDGGRDSSTVRRISALLPFWDRTIDVMVATHPDSDHITGLKEVLKRYSVTTFLEPGVYGKTHIAREVHDIAEKEASHMMLARRGQVFDFGDGVLLYILFPDRDVSGVETNTGSVVALIEYKKTHILLTGDSPQKIEKYLVSIDGVWLHSDVLKAGHHGSKTSSSELFIGYVNPASVVFSRGCHNRYGHPHPSIVALYTRFSIPQYDTCKQGTITFVSNGDSIHKVR